MATINIINSGTPGTAIAKDATDNTLTKLASVSGAFTQNSLVVAQDVNGSIKNLTNVNSAVLLTDATGTPTYSSTLTDGQIIIGDTGGIPVAGTITGSGNAIVTVGAGTIDISVTSGTINSSTANNLAYYATNGDTISGLASANNGLLVTSALGVPSIGNAIGADITINTVTAGKGKNSISQNTAFGFATLGSISTGDRNTGFGWGTGNALTNSQDNTLIGNAAGLGFVNGNSNTIVGSQAFSNANLGTNGLNTLIGFQAGQNARNGSSLNVGVGVQTLANLNGGDFNVGCGPYTGLQITSGTYNTCIGYYAGALIGSGVTSGSYNLFLGVETGVDNFNCSNAIAIGYGSIARIATGSTSSTFGPGISFGSSGSPVGFRGDGTIITGGTGRGYWRPNINGTYYLMPLFVSGTTTVNAAMVTDANGSPILSNSMTDGQIIIGSSSGQPQAGNITAGANITVTNSANGITIAASVPTGFSYTDVTGTTQSLAVDSGYIANNPSTLITFTLPATAAIGTVIEIVGNGAGLWTLAQNAGQSVLIVGVTTTTGTGGSLTATAAGDGIRLICTVADTKWTGIPTGNLTIV